MTNCRPISISKAIEKVLCQQISDHLELHDPLTKNQWGFRPSNNTSLAMSVFLEIILKGLDASNFLSFFEGF